MGAVVIALWSFAFSFLFFYLAKILKVLRIPERIERKGLDFEKHGGIFKKNSFNLDVYNRGESKLEENVEKN